MPDEMIIHNVRTVYGDKKHHIRISGDKITQVSDYPMLGRNNDFELHMEHALVFPGLINSHDHLDFNLFPSFGEGTYPSYFEWGSHLHQTYKKEIESVTTIPLPLREAWGMYKNLLCGVTTVINHGNPVQLKKRVIAISDDAQSIHSVRFEKNWKRKLNNPLKRNIPVVIHVGEGTNKASFTEINELRRWNLLRRKLIGIHGVAMSEKQARSFKALVWCPQSNDFLLKTSAPVMELKKSTKILFGTDSTLTGHWNIWEHLKDARQLEELSDGELYRSITLDAAKIWNLNTGDLAAGRDADLVVAKTKTGQTGYNTFFSLGPQDLLLVLFKGTVSLFDESLLAELKPANLDFYTRIYIAGSVKYVLGDLKTLVLEIGKFNKDIQFPFSFQEGIQAGK